MLGDFSKAFGSIHRRKMEQILVYDLPKETVTAIMVLYRNMKVKVRSPDGDTDFFDIVAGFLQGYIIFVYDLPGLCTLNVDRSNKRKLLYAKNGRSRRYPSETTIDANYADDIALLAHTPAQVESWLHSLEQVAVVIDLHEMKIKQS